MVSEIIALDSPSSSARSIRIGNTHFLDDDDVGKIRLPDVHLRDRHRH